VLKRYTPLQRSTKPIKRSPIQRKPQTSRTRTLRDGREVCTGSDWEKRRQEVHLRASGRCERELLIDTGGQRRRRMRCDKPAPLHNFYNGDGEVVIPAGHAHHKRRRGMGGGFRDDRAANLEWVCSGCHIEEHRPKRTVRVKVR